MQASTQTRPPHSTPRSLGTRLLALFAMLLVFVASTLQVCHSHGEPGFGPGKAARASAAPGSSSLPSPVPTDRQTTPEDHCPLCVAMHSALPATSHIELNQVVTLAPIDSTAAEAARLFRWRFELLSRPPPTTTL